MAAELCSIYIDGTHAYTGDFDACRLRSIRLSLSQSSRNLVAVDNITVHGLARPSGPSDLDIVARDTVISKAPGSPSVGSVSQWALYVAYPGRAAFAVGTEGLVSSSCVYPNRWAHLAGVRTGDTMLFYVNGLLEGARSLSSALSGQNAPLTIGARVKNSELEYEFEGLIDEIAIYNTALPAEQIEQRLYTRLTGREPGLVAYWDFDDGSGQVVKDLSGNGNHAYLGTDPDDYDTSDPHWNLSDAPLDSCPPAEIILRSLTRAVELKNDILHLLNQALDNEQTAIRLLDQLFKTKEDFHPDDVNTIRRQVRAAILRERLSRLALERTRRRLQTALAILTGEVLPATPSEVDAELESADVNVDGVVDFSDFAIMMNHWLESYRPEQQ